MTTDGATRPLERPFLVLATQNPIEYEGTYPLPEAQLDRFLLRTGFGYPGADDEWEMLARRIERREDDVTLSQVIDRADAARDAGGRRARARRSVGRALHRRPRRGDAREHEPRRRREPARQPRAAQALPLPGRARRARLRHAGRREGDRRARARASAARSSRSSGCSGARARTSSATRSSRCRRPRPRTSRTPWRDAVRLAAARAVPRPRGARADRGARAAAGPSSSSSRHRSR